MRDFALVAVVKVAEAMLPCLTWLLSIMEQRGARQAVTCRVAEANEQNIKYLNRLLPRTWHDIPSLPYVSRRQLAARAVAFAQPAPRL